ncbi:T9SS type A sorting domain-containing protein [Polaribacter sp. L3A8]|uniref:T9SS type A sorting domain-containing protein n=1 Tax=Polaribacter sp. L3A8 TaxID=2686361 RepID=UPI00131E0B6C|nr:T9SS type A sorting domain-containing protein [Polaribacter sp. L3A8]
MMKKITFLLLFSISFITNGQTMVNDFESSGETAPEVRFGLTTEIVANPFPTGLNTTANCLQVGRANADFWYSLTIIDVDPDINFLPTDKKFLSVMVNYPVQPDLVVRFNSSADGEIGTNAGVLRAINTYDTSGDNANTWQEIIFEIKSTTSGPHSFTQDKLFNITFHADAGFENVPAGRILSDFQLGYLDQFRVLNVNPLSTKSFILDNAISVYPNPTSSVFKVKIDNSINVESISFYNILGKDVTNNVIKNSKEEYDFSNLSSGIYMMKLSDNKGNLSTKKIIKK